MYSGVEVSRLGLHYIKNIKQEFTQFQGLKTSPFYPLIFSYIENIKRIHTILKDCKTYVTNGPIII
jgi:hypothetical protein